jgi:hypothetical protein
MLRCVACVEECIGPIIRVTRISEVETLAIASNRSKLQRNTMCISLQIIEFFGFVHCPVL